MKQAIEAAAEPLCRREDGSFRQRFRFADDFPGFDGHFPGYPVLPAIVQVLAAQSVVEGMLKRPLVMKGLERAKFLRPVLPGETLEVDCRVRRSGDRQVWDVRLSADEKPAAAFWMIPGEENEP